MTKRMKDLTEDLIRRGRYYRTLKNIIHNDGEDLARQSFLDFLMIDIPRQIEKMKGSTLGGIIDELEVGDVTSVSGYIFKGGSYLSGKEDFKEDAPYVYMGSLREMVATYLAYVICDSLMKYD
jgi:hypothetical protein